ncbi:hypothetical protein F4805DRAFT_38621 [Annulohypoxylon moriforme]|nr:hypothetical protein F4805DRAFT_38621 [Annulohypoxylon moriforme]
MSICLVSAAWVGVDYRFARGVLENEKHILHITSHYISYLIKQASMERKRNQKPKRRKRKKEKKEEKRSHAVLYVYEVYAFSATFILFFFFFAWVAWVGEVRLGVWRLWLLLWLAVGSCNNKN